ncbi:meiosis-specific protein ASY2-like [Brassica napus]|uniref:meiosis-specific protein ASY2-like n=1 Tax=Brassica napus TaxID=3708 RepID=UPI00207887A0|nr:meiosis-specific protein ASY2-like [Brassica napus]
MMMPRGGTPSFPINIRFLLTLSILLRTSQVFSLSSFLFLSVGGCCNIDSDISSDGRLSHKQRGKEIVASSSPSRDTTEAPLEEFEWIHHDAMMDTGNLDLSQRILIFESARSYRQEVRGNPDERQACERDGSGGARDGALAVNYVQTCYYPGGIFEELPALASEFLRSPDVSGQAWENVTETQSTPNSVKKLLRERHGLGVTFLIPSENQRPWSPPVGYQCVYESYFRDDTKLWFPIPRLVTSYARRRDAAISLFLNGSWRIAVALMVMAAEIDVSLSIRVFEELTSVSSLDDGLLLIKMRPSYNVIGRHPNKTPDWQRSYFFDKSDHPTSRYYPEDFLTSAHTVAGLAQEHWGNISLERVYRSIDRISRKDWNSSYPLSANKTKRRISLFTKEEQKRINEARKMRGLPDLSAIMTVELNLPSVELPAPSNEMAIADTTDASPHHQDSSAGTTTLAPKKKKGEKRPRDDLPVNSEETAEPSSKKRKRGNQQPQAAGIVRPRETDVANPVHRSESAGEPALNLASLDDLEDASPKVTLRKKKKSKTAGDRETVASALVSSIPGTSAVGASSRKKTPRVEFPDHVSFEYDGPTPLIYAPYKCAEFVSQIKCGPKPLPSVSDLIFKDEYVDAACTKLLKYDTALKETREALRKLEKVVAAKGKLLRRKKAEWRDEFVRMAEKRERAIVRKKIQRERADEAEAEHSIANVTTATLESRKASLMEEMGVKAEEHKKELGWLRDSRIYEVTKERMRVETEMIAKSNRHFGNLREWWTRCGPFDTA